jgi:uridine kinase
MGNQKHPLVIGIAGGTGSGKTTVANEIFEQVGENIVSYLPHDAYYKDLSSLPPVQRAAVNFDHPNSLDTDLMKSHIEQLKIGQGIELPVYDFTTHCRTKETINIPPNPVILVEGILIFVDPEMRDLFDVKRSIESILQQYQTTVRPMHLEFVEPSKRYADVIIPEGGYNIVALQMVIARIESMLRELQEEE